MGSVAIETDSWLLYKCERPMATSSPAIAAVSEDIYLSRDIIRIALVNSLRDGERKRALCILYPEIWAFRGYLFLCSFLY